MTDFKVFVWEVTPMAKRIEQDIVNNIKSDYISNGTDIRTLADKYGVSFATISKWSAKEGWEDKRQEFKRNLEECILIKQQEQRLSEVENVNIADVENWNLFKQKTVLMLMNTNKPIELSHLAQIYERAQKGVRLALGLDKEDRTNTDVNITVQLPDGFGVETEVDEGEDDGKE